MAILEILGEFRVIAGIKLKEAICEIEAAFCVIGGKWKPIILWYLGENDVIRLEKFQQLIPDITHRILTKQLRELAACGLIKRTVFHEIPVKVEYSITEKGKDVLPILNMMCDWASKNAYFSYKIKYNLCRESD
jgi:DNA-binding HxlR family transcriptional regulator